MSTPSIASRGEAEEAIANLHAIIDRLVATVEDETAHVRAGRLHDALALEDSKNTLARRYMTESSRLQAARAIVAQSSPDALKRLSERHQSFQALLRTNLTVLATAHAVAEGIIRGVSGELTRKRAPQTYGSGGRANVPDLKASQPLAVSRSL